MAGVTKCFRAGRPPVKLRKRRLVLNILINDPFAMIMFINEPLSMDIFINELLSMNRIQMNMLCDMQEMPICQPLYIDVHTFHSVWVGRPFLILVECLLRDSVLAARIDLAVSGTHTFVWTGTGSGKSLCFYTRADGSFDAMIEDILSSNKKGFLRGILVTNLSNVSEFYSPAPRSPNGKRTPSRYLNCFNGTCTQAAPN